MPSALSNLQTLKSIQEIKTFFELNQIPIYFISPSNFNLMGIERYVSNFKSITYINSFDNHDTSVFTPSYETAHAEFTSVEDINNYLLEHPEVIGLISNNVKGEELPKALFLMFDSMTESLVRKHRLELSFPSASLRNFLDNKVNTNRIAEKANVPCVPYVLSKVISYSDLKLLSQDLGTDLVIQTPFGDSGHTTFFIQDEEQYNKYAEQIEKEDEVKIMKRINCYGTAIEGCVTKKWDACSTINDRIGRV